MVTIKNSRDRTISILETNTRHVLLMCQDKFRHVCNRLWSHCILSYVTIPVTVYWSSFLSVNIKFDLKMCMEHILWYKTKFRLRWGGRYYPLVVIKLLVFWIITFIYLQRRVVLLQQLHYSSFDTFIQHKCNEKLKSRVQR